MPDYRIACQEHDGRWFVQEFQSADDPDAISYVLSIRTAARCELFQGDRWLATFDGSTEFGDVGWSQANENSKRGSVEIETEIAYFYRRALEERERARTSANDAAKLAHLNMAEHLESLGRIVQAEQRRSAFYDVNASQGKPQKLQTSVCPVGGTELEPRRDHR